MLCTTGWSSAQYHKHESSRFACHCTVYYKSSLRSQPIVLIQYEEYTGRASLCVQQRVVEHGTVCASEELPHVRMGIAAVLEGSIPKFRLANFCVTLVSD